MNKLLTFNLPYKVKIIEENNEENNKKDMVNFSIVVINRNEEEKLKTFLVNLKDFRDNNGEIIVLDIDSIDKTNNTCKEFNCKVVDVTEFYKTIDTDIAKSINEKFDFDNNGIIKAGDKYFDYSEARNYGHSISTNDMIFMMDIDSNVLEFDLLNIVRYVFNGNDKLNFTNLNKKNHVCEFYNRKKYTWENNTLKTTLNNIKERNIEETILRVQSHKKPHVNLLTELALTCFTIPNNIESSLSFAIELMNNNYDNSALQEFNRHITICNSNMKRSESLVYIGDILIKSDRKKEAVEYYNKAYIECSTWRLPLYKLGKHFHFTHERDKAIFYLEGCLNIPKPVETDEDDFIYADGPYSMLYVDYWWIGDKKKGKYNFDKALEFNPYNPLYIEEAKYHYDYIGNTIVGNLSFQDIQYLYKESKKSKSILEIYPENGRSTHALLKGCDGLVTVILKDSNTNYQFLESLENPGNLRIINNMEILENEKFDIVLIHNYNDIINDYNQYWGILIWEKFANKLVCGSNYNEFKNIIDGAFEISGIENNIWYKNISSFEKNIIYKRKNYEE